MVLHIGAWHWGAKYPQFYIDRLRSGLRRHLTIPYKFHIWKPEREDEYLTEIPGCLCRLRMFDRFWQQQQGIYIGDRIVCMDLDSVVVGRLDELFWLDEPFSILQGANSSNPGKFNGSLWSFVVGYGDEVWQDFSLEATKAIPYYEFPDDQAWMEAQLPCPSSWKVGAESGVFAFAKPGWVSGTDLPAEARLVVFPGWRDPAKFQHLSWVKQNWR